MIKTTGAVTLVDCGCRAEAYTDDSGIEIYYCATHEAAPELLEALKALIFPMEAWNEAVESVTGEQPIVNDAITQARAAIAKAEG